MHDPTDPVGELREVALVAGNFVAAERPKAYGLVMGAGAIAIAVGPPIGGVATTYFAWR